MANEIEASRQLIKLYEEAFDRILERLTKKIASGKYTGRDAGLLKSVNEELWKLQASNQSFSRQIVEPLYKSTRQDTLERLEREGVVPTGANFDSVHSEAIKLTQTSLVHDLTNQVGIIGRQVNDYLRSGGIEAAQLIQSGQMTSKQAIQGFISDFEKNFLVTYSDGKKVPIDSYAKMAVNTTIDSSINKSVFTTNKEYDNDLVRMSWHSTSCPMCAQYQGRVYSLSGESEEYPALDVINKGSVITYNTVHPNCRHRFLPYVEEFEQNKEEIKKYSNSPIEDNRTKISKKRYDMRQTQNRYKLEQKRLERENIVLKSMPKTDERQRMIEGNNKKIAFRKDRIKKIKKWDIDNPKTDQNLFTKLPPK